MSRSLNKVTLIGNVGSDPEIRTTGGGTKMAKVSLATNRIWTDKSGQRQEKTEWHRLTFWDRMADLIEQYVKKGDRLYVEGRLEYSTTEDDKGVQRYWTDINVQEMIMLGSGGGGGGGGYEGGGAPQRRRQTAPSAPQGSPFDSDDDDLPF